MPMAFRVPEDRMSVLMNINRDIGHLFLLSFSLTTVNGFLRGKLESDYHSYSSHELSNLLFHIIGSRSLFYTGHSEISGCTRSSLWYLVEAEQYSSELVSREGYVSPSIIRTPMVWWEISFYASRSSVFSSS